MDKPARQGLWVVLLALLGAALLSAFLWTTQLSLGVDQRLHDQLTRNQTGTSLASTAEPPQGIVLVDIDEPSLAQLGPWPWPRTVLAELATKIRQRGGKIQVWDLFISEKVAGDDALEQVLKAGNDIVLGQVLVLDDGVQAPPRVGRLVASPEPAPLCATIPSTNIVTNIGTNTSKTPGKISGHLGVSEGLPSARVGHLSATPSPDGNLRRLPAFLCADTQSFPQLTLAAAQLLEPNAPWQLIPVPALEQTFGPAAWLRRGALSYPLDADGYIALPHRRPHSQWAAVSALKILDGTDLHSGAPISLKGKVVVLGATAVGLGDTVSTPFHPNAPGVSVHAELLAAAADGGWTTPAARPLPWVMVLTMALSALMLWAWQSWRKVAWLLLAAACLLCAPLALAVLARFHGLELPVFAPTAAAAGFGVLLLVLQVWDEKRKARMLTKHLESFLPAALAQEIASNLPSNESLGRPAEGPVLVLRIVGLERWSARVDSLQALALVHACTSLCEKHARAQGGTLAHVKGDTLIMAWKGAANEDKNHKNKLVGGPVESSLLAAKSLVEELTPLLHRNEFEACPLSINAALESGPYLLAVAGSSTRRRPLILGPAVDTATAMLGLSEELASVLLLGPVAHEAQPQVAGMQLHTMGQFLLPDASRPVSLSRIEF
jgi:adenylate cyclase